jgi:hypothetical protein
MVKLHLFHRFDSDNQKNDQEQRLMLDISLKFGILCPLTTFFAIEKHLNNDEITMPSQQQQIPIQICAQHFRNTKLNYAQCQTISVSRCQTILFITFCFII